MFDVKALRQRGEQEGKGTHTKGNFKDFKPWNFLVAIRGVLVTAYTLTGTKKLFVFVEMHNV